MIGGNSMLFPADIVVDSNEESRSDAVVRELSKLGMRVAVSKLEAGDYFIPFGSGPQGILVERKRAEDFINSILDSRLWSQARALSSASREGELTAVFLIEGDLWEVLEEREISPTAVVRAIDEIAIEFRIPVIYTRDPQMTARWMAAKVRALKEEGRGEGKFLPYVRRKAATESERILNSLAVIAGYETARKLLTAFGTLRAVVSSSIEQLMAVEGIGEARAKKLYRLFNMKFEEREERAGEK